MKLMIEEYITYQTVYLKHLRIPDEFSGAVIDESRTHTGENHEEDDEDYDHVFFLEQSSQCVDFTLEE